MAYGVKYIITFYSQTNIRYTLHLSLKDYSGSAPLLEAGPDPFVLNYQSGDDEIINAIRASEATIQFYSPPGIAEFYSEDDQAWKVQFYEYLTSVLIWTGFIVQDSCTEALQDAPYLVTLRATDNIGLLKDIQFDEGYKNLYAEEVTIKKMPLIDYFKIAFFNTGILLPVEIYSNLYENTETDRGPFGTADMFQTEYLYNNTFLNENGTWKDLYYVLETILKPLNATFLQAGGKWVIIRQTEFKLFSNAIPGTSYDPDFAAPLAVALDPVFPVAIDSDNVFINADAQRSILRPLKSVLHFFEFVLPPELIFNTAFTRHGAVVGLTEWYEITDEWTIINGLPGYVYIAAITNDEGAVVRRYLILNTLDDGYRFLRFNPIEVVAGSRFNFSCDLTLLWTRHDSNNNFHTRFILLTPGGQYYAMAGVIDPDGTVSTFLQWLGPYSTPIPAATHEVIFGISAVVWDIDNPPFPQTGHFNLENFIRPNTLLPDIPADGLLLIDFSRMEHGPADDPMLEIKNIKIEFENVLQAGSTAVLTGQKHLQTLNNNPKNKLEKDILMDDSPVNVLAGTLFTSALTNFAETIGNIHFTKTLFWHRGDLAEARRLGEIATLERSQIQSKPRAIVEGTIHFTDIPTPLNVFQVDTLPDLNLIPGVMEINYGAAMCSLKLWEIYETGETDAEPVYKFDYIKEPIQ